MTSARVLQEREEQLRVMAVELRRRDREKRHRDREELDRMSREERRVAGASDSHTSTSTKRSINFRLIHPLPGFANLLFACRSRSSSSERGRSRRNSGERSSRRSDDVSSDASREKSDRSKRLVDY